MAKDVIGDVLVREGGAKVTHDLADAGGRTQYGISERSNPGAWADGKVTEEEARAIYEAKYIDYPGFRAIKDPALFQQMVDYGVLSGPGIAIMKLQAILGADVDGVLGPQTLALLANRDAREINNKLVVARVLMICKIVQRNPSQIKYILGWASRALDFLR